MCRLLLLPSRAAAFAAAAAGLVLASAPAGAQLPCVPTEQWSLPSQSCAMPVLGQFTDDDGDGRITEADDPDVAFWRRDDSTPGTSFLEFVLADAATGFVHRAEPLFN
ncbi:MAG TPA: hypothetical protein VLA56_08490, partial [Pseudomonadales bacterium]|nr:hypothetical protein [Pseudomonadales bacterium]